MEATGSYSNSYSNAVALFVAEAKQKVSVLNPARIHFFARSHSLRVHRGKATRQTKPLPASSPSSVAKSIKSIKRLGVPQPRKCGS